MVLHATLHAAPWVHSFLLLLDMRFMVAYGKPRGFMTQVRGDARSAKQHVEFIVFSFILECFHSASWFMVMHDAPRGQSDEANI